MVADPIGVATVTLTLPADITLAEDHTLGLVVRGAGGKPSIETRRPRSDIR